MVAKNKQTKTEFSFSQKVTSPKFEKPLSPKFCNESWLKLKDQELIFPAPPRCDLWLNSGKTTWSISFFLHQKKGNYHINLFRQLQNSGETDVNFV